MDEHFGFIPANTAVGYGLSVVVTAAGLKSLAAFDHIAFEHYTGYLGRSAEKESGCVESVWALVAIVFVGIGMGAIEHDGSLERWTG